MIIESAVALGLYLYGKREIAKRAPTSTAAAQAATLGGAGLVTLPDGSVIDLGTSGSIPTPSVPSTLAQQQGGASPPAAPPTSIAQPAPAPAPTKAPDLYAAAAASPAPSGYVTGPVRYTGV